MQHILDLDRYPLDRPGTPEWQAMVDSARADLARDGMFNLPGLMRPTAIAGAISELTPRFETEAFTHARKHNIYFRKEVDGLAPDHPALALRETKSHTLCADQIGGVVRALYDWPHFATFLAASMGKDRLHHGRQTRRRERHDLPRGRGAELAFRPLGIHHHAAVATPTKAAPSNTAPTCAAIPIPITMASPACCKAEPELQSITLVPGTLNVFRGKNTAHRVTPVQGNTNRIITVFSFFDRPGVVFTPEEQIGFYGRAA